MRLARTVLITTVTLMLAVFLLPEPCPAAEAEAPGSVLIRNVRLSDPKAEAEYVVVSLLVKQGKLEIDVVSYLKAQTIANPEAGDEIRPVEGMGATTADEVTGTYHARQQEQPRDAKPTSLLDELTGR